MIMLKIYCFYQPSSGTTVAVMAPTDFAVGDLTDNVPWYWYVLISYPVLSLLGIVSLARLTSGGSVLASSLGSIVLLIVITAVGTVSLPALWQDAEFVTSETDVWRPNRKIYVGAAVAPSLLLGVLSSLAAGFAFAVAITILTFLLSTVAVCVAYLYNRYRTIGISAR